MHNAELRLKNSFELYVSLILCFANRDAALFIFARESAPAKY
jgi:hypothetical protein